LVPGGIVPSAGQREVAPRQDEVYTLEVEDMAGRLTQKRVTITVMAPLRIQEFRAEPSTVELDGEVVFRWTLSRPADVLIDLFDRPQGSRAAFQFRGRSAAGSAKVVFDKGSFTRYGAHTFRILVRDGNEAQESNARVVMRQNQ
jgi:hypothetical protein